MAEQVNKAHRPSAGKKQHAGGPNPKAFGFAKPGKLNRQAVRSHDIKEKRLHVPLVDRLPEEAPPIVVGVVGPPGVGKTTLIKSLIRRYSKQTLSAPVGPLTVVTSKRRRLTFIECPAESLASMIDVAKIVDIVLLMIDGNYGFEMETMEFLNVLNATGMPGNVFGILTHLDLFRKQDALRAQKKRLKHRFWSELYQGAKLFYLSGVINGRYPDREVLNLSRFLSVMKNPRPLVWRNSHPYCLADRFLDITPPLEIEENSKCDRTVALYGYLRGTNFPVGGSRVHIPGVGDLQVSRIEGLPDPCPTPFMDQSAAKSTGKEKRRRLGEKQKVLFAPMSDVGGVLVDQDAVYIDVKTSTFSRDVESEEDDRGLGEQMDLGLQGDRKLLGAADGGVRLFANGQLVDTSTDQGRKMQRHARVIEKAKTLDDYNTDFDGDDDSDESDDHFGLPGTLDEVQEEPYTNSNGSKKGSDRINGDASNIAFQESDSDLGSVSTRSDHELESDSFSDDDNDIGYDLREGSFGPSEANGTQKINNMLSGTRPFRTEVLARLMYDTTLSPQAALLRWRGQREAFTVDSMPEQDDEFFKKSDGTHDLVGPGGDEAHTYDYYQELEVKWTKAENLETLRKRFASTNSASGSNAHVLGERGDSESDNEGTSEDDADESDEGDGAFEDLETGETFEPERREASTLEAERERNAKKKEQLKLRFEEEDREGFANDKAGDRGLNGTTEDFGEDDWYDAQKAHIQKQLDINRAEFDAMDDLSRVRMEGYKAGTYARIVLSNVPYEFCDSFSPRVPIVIGGLTPTEDRLGFVQVRIKRHRWYKKILKTNDPLIFSLGWRRFQTMPIYSISDSRTRNRMLKYTPEHMFCFGTFYGPLIAPNTGFCCVQSFSNSNPGFRVAATGVVLSVDEGTEIVKKLKLTGHAYKIFKNTAFVKDMFASSLEIAKFEGASIRTVSGIRGQIKRALSKPDGCFRATFEDKVLMSDIIFLKAWYPIKPHRFYNPVTNLLVTAAATAAVSKEHANGRNDHDSDSEIEVHQEVKDGNQWTAMRLTGQLRAEQKIPTPLNKDSSYRPIYRSERHFNPLRVPKKLSADLPFASQPVAFRPQAKKPYLQQRMELAESMGEKKKRALLQQIETVRKDKIERRAEKQEERRQGYRAKVKEGLEKKAEREKREKEEFWRVEGRKRKLAEDKQASRASGGGGGGSGGKRKKM